MSLECKNLATSPRALAQWRRAGPAIESATQSYIDCVTIPTPNRREEPAWYSKQIHSIIHFRRISCCISRPCITYSWWVWDLLGAAGWWMPPSFLMALNLGLSLSLSLSLPLCECVWVCVWVCMEGADGRLLCVCVSFSMCARETWCLHMTSYPLIATFHYYYNSFDS